MAFLSPKVLSQAYHSARDFIKGSLPAPGLGAGSFQVRPRRAVSRQAASVRPVKSTKGR